MNIIAEFNSESSSFPSNHGNVYNAFGWNFIHPQFGCLDIKYFFAFDSMIPFCDTLYEGFTKNCKTCI